MAKKEKETLTKEEYAEMKRKEFDTLVKKANGNDPVLRSVAQKELNKRRKKADNYLRKNEPAKWAEKLRAKADYYDQKAEEMNKGK